MDDNRKWWKAKNNRGQTGHVPHTIVTPYNYNNQDPDRYDPQIPETSTGNRHIGKKGEFRYF